MQRNRVFFVLIALLASMVLVLAGCGGGEEEEEEAAAAEPEQESYVDNPYTDGEDLSGRTVNIFGAFVDTDAERFEAAMEPFEEETGIDIQYEGSGDFESLITVRTEGGDPPDVAAWPQPGLMRDIADRGHIIDLAEWMDMEYLEQQYDQSWLDLATYDDMMAGVWYRASVKSLVWYPVPEFEEEGYEIPETWEELMELSQQMVDDGNTPWTIGIESSGATGWVATDWLEDLMLRLHPPEVYDEWVAGELPFDSPEVREAMEIMEEIWKDPDFVRGGQQSILTVPFGDAPNPLFNDPPRAWLHRQASFISAFFPDGAKVGEDVDYFYLPPISEEEGGVGGRPVLGAGDMFSALQDKPEVEAVMRWLTTGESTRGWLEQGGFVSPHKDTPLDWYPSDVDRGYAEILQDATVFRFDASDLMPGQVGTGSFWTGMVDWVNGDPLDEVLPAIDEGWPEDDD
ncbi:MAG: ABC transporter substrate-binding protein [Spirochaetaceae bacterium]